MLQYMLDTQVLAYFKYKLQLQKTKIHLKKLYHGDVYLTNIVPFYNVIV